MNTDWRNDSDWGNNRQIEKEKRQKCENTASGRYCETIKCTGSMRQNA